MGDTLAAELLVLKNVSLHGPVAGSNFFECLNWVVRPGERWAIVGPEGCGKSTLLRLMAGLIRPDAGEVLLNGLPCTTTTNRSDTIGVLFCEPASRFLAPVVWEEVVLTLSSHGVTGEPLQQQLDQALQLAGLSKDMASRELASLSTSQCARVALAAALAVAPQLLLVDEPGAQLAAEGEVEMARMLASQAQSPKNMASVIFTSRMERARRFAERFLWLADGHINSSDINSSDKPFILPA